MDDLENSMLSDPVPEPEEEDGDAGYDRLRQEQVDDEAFRKKVTEDAMSELVKITNLLDKTIKRQAE